MPTPARRKRSATPSRSIAQRPAPLGSNEARRKPAASAPANVTHALARSQNGTARASSIPPGQASVSNWAASPGSRRSSASAVRVGAWSGRSSSSVMA